MLVSQQAELEKGLTATEADLTPYQAAQWRMARRWEEQGKLHQAIAAYCQLAERWPRTPAARLALGRMMALATDLERRGAERLALDLYRKLEELGL